MRKIGTLAIVCFSSGLTLVIVAAVATVLGTLGKVPLGDYRGVTVATGILVATYVFAFLAYRIFLHCFPLKPGFIEEGSRDEQVAHVNILCYLILFNSLTRTHFIPVPIMRLAYLALGAKLGENTYCAGTLLDPPLTRMGKNCIVGHNAVLYAHTIEGRYFALEPIVIGDNVTIGAMATVMSGVVIGDGAIVSAGAVVRKGTVIGAGETWGGVPARLLKPAAGDPA